MAKIMKVEDKFYFDAEDGTEAVEVKTWLETSKRNEAHPDGKLWIKLPKDNVTNRQYFSVDKFEAENVDGEITVEVKTTGPRVLGSTRVNPKIVKYLDEDLAAEYTQLVEGAVEAFTAAKAASKKKRVEDMNADELAEYIEALKNGVQVSVNKLGPKSFIEMFTEEEYNRYSELVALAQENKANAPRAKRGPLTEEEKKARKAKRVAKELSKAEQLLAAMLANQDL